MSVTGLAAAPVPGGRIALSWINPSTASFAGVRVLRATGSYPDIADLGTAREIYQDSQSGRGAAAGFVDGPLQGETVYYYAVVSYDVGNRKEAVFTSAMALVPYESAAMLYNALPSIYRIFDGERGQLRRFMDILGVPFDEIRSSASAMRTFHDVRRVDAALLPLLSTWVGQPLDTTLSPAQQRNAIQYAPQYHRTAGTPEALRAAMNRFTNWNARVKEFVHNVFLTTHPEHLLTYSSENTGSGWSAPIPVNNEVAFEGRVSPLPASDGRLFLFYHARKLTAGNQPPEWQIFAKPGDGQAAWQVTNGGTLFKHPAAIQRKDGALWMFYSSYPVLNGRPTPQLQLRAMSVGAGALPATIVGTAVEPFALSPGDTFELKLTSALGIPDRMVTLRPENYAGNLGAATAKEISAFLDAELPGVSVSASSDGRVMVTSFESGAAVKVAIPASPIATKVGLIATVTGSDAIAAQLTGFRKQPFALADGNALRVSIDGSVPRTITFQKSQFANIGAATAAEVVAAIDAQLPGLASAAGTTVQLNSLPGASSRLMLHADAVTAALGFCAPPPSSQIADSDEASAFLDPTGNVWLFWASRQDGNWRIWYARFSGNTWEAPKEFTTTGTIADREPFAVFDPTGAGRVWVFWSGKKKDGSWNVFTRTTTTVDFAALNDAAWTQKELLPAPAGANNREPAAILAGAGAVDLYYASDRANGWNVWTRSVDAGVQGAESQVTTGSDTRRAPAAVRLEAKRVRLYHRSNAPRAYTSSTFPMSQTFDARYSGSSTCDTRNPLKLSLRGRFEDEQRYTSDTRRMPPGTPLGGKNLAGLFARDAVGVFLTPDTSDQELIFQSTRMFAEALLPFQPVTARLAFLVDEKVFTDEIYTYETASSATPVVMGEQAIDTILSEVLPQPLDERVDAAPAVHFVRTWPAAPAMALPDLSVHPPDLNARLFTSDYAEGS